MVESRKGRSEGKWHRKSVKSVQALGWQMLEKSCRKTSGLFRLTCGGNHPHTGVRKILPCMPRNKNPNSSKRREHTEGPWQNRSCLWGGEGWRKEKSCHSILPIHYPLWMAGDSAACSSLQLTGHGCCEWNPLWELSSGQDAGRQSCGRVCYLKRLLGRSATGSLIFIKLILKKREKDREEIATDNVWMLWEKPRANQI